MCFIVFKIVLILLNNVLFLLTLPIEILIISTAELRNYLPIYVNCYLNILCIYFKNKIMKGSNNNDIK